MQAEREGICNWRTIHWAQIVCEVLSREPAITEYAIVESALVLPVKGVTVFTAPACGLCYGLIKRRWFSKMQAKPFVCRMNGSNGIIGTVCVSANSP